MEDRDLFYKNVLKAIAMFLVQYDFTPEERKCIEKLLDFNVDD